MGNDWDTTDGNEAMNNPSDEVEIFGETIPDDDGPQVHIPAPFEPEWDDYVLSHFQPNEFFNNNPTVDGLRRVTEKIVGPIIESNTKVESAPHINDRYATVVVEIVCSTLDGNK